MRTDWRAEAKLEKKIPQQELFLEVKHEDGDSSRIFLSDLPEMSDTVLSGFIQWMIAKTKEMDMIIENFAEQSKLDHLDENEKKHQAGLRFKRKMFGAFLFNALEERKNRKRAKKEWLNEFKSRNEPFEPCPWLEKFGLPITFDAWNRLTFGSARSRLKKLIDLLTIELGQERLSEILESSKIEQVPEEVFIAHTIAANKILDDGIL